jgi:hypothetical protein
MGLGAMIGGVLGLMLMLRLVRQRIVPWMRTGTRFVQECEGLLWVSSADWADSLATGVT